MRTNVPRVRFIVLALTLTFLCSRSYSQSITTDNGKWEIGLGFGPMFFLGDLGGTAGIGKPFVKDLDFPLTKISKNLYVNYYATDWLGFRLAINHGHLEGDDAEAPNKGGAEMDRLERNLSFKSSVLEGYLAAEVYPTVFFEQYEGLEHKFRPYVLSGVGVMKFNPKAKLDDKWIELHPLRLEGQGMAEYPDRKEYKLIQQEFLLGFGFKYYLKENFYVGLEVLHRKTWCDYIDDASTFYVDPAVFDNYLSAADAANARRLYYRGTYQGSVPGSVTRPDDVLTYQRGDPKENDAYFSTIFRFGWRLNNENSAQKRQLRCPVFY
ncbi:MAG: hypothetical protein ACHQFX_12565 [Chitinophagales bacterium]